jgi:hypothetical protein
MRSSANLPETFLLTILVSARFISLPCSLVALLTYVDTCTLPAVDRQLPTGYRQPPSIRSSRFFPSWYLISSSNPRLHSFRSFLLFSLVES